VDQHSSNGGVRALVAALAIGVVLACAGSGEGLDRDGRPLRVDAGADGGEEPADAGEADGGADLDGGTDAGIDAGVVDERVRYAWVQKNVFTQVCASYCHRGASAPKSLQLDAVNGYQRIVNVKSTEVPSLLLVKPGDPMNSYLYIKVIPADPRRVGERMPLNEPPYLPTEKLEAIRGWIARGAPRD
jgi:hypothetical protein